MDLSSHRARRIAWWICALAVLPTLALGMRTYGAYKVLRSAYEAGAPSTSNLRGWMTLDYIAAAYHTPKPALIVGLHLPPTTAGDKTLVALAREAGVLPPDYVARVQRVIAPFARPAAPGTEKTPGWLSSISDKMLSALLVYGYPVLGLTLLLGAIGLPLPDGIATAVAGSLAAQGRMDWLLAAAVIVLASVLGDAAGYGIGRLLGAEVLTRRGRWFGYSPERRGRAQRLFDRWGLLTVFITRTFVSYLSSIASVLAGVARYRLSRFLGVAFAGRVLWAAAYLGLGAAVGSDLEAAAGFLTYLSLLLLLLTLLTISGLIATGRVPVISSQRIV